MDIGIEVVVYWGSQEARNLGKPVVALYCYGGGNIDIPEISNDIATIADILLQSSSLIESEGASVIQGLATSCRSSLSASVNISGFIVSGNESFTNSTDYTKGFDTVSAGIGKGRASYAWSPCCRTVGVGASILGGAAGFSATRGKLYYYQLWSSAAKRKVNKRSPKNQFVA